MRIIYSDEIEQDYGNTMEEKLWLYNALDNCITHEVHLAQLRDLPAYSFAYNMSRAMQGPALTMMRRGVRVNFIERDRLITEYEHDRIELARKFDRLCTGVVGGSVNPASPAQLQKLFYEALGHEPITKYDRQTKERKITTDREALEKLSKHRKCGIFANFILSLRELDKTLQFLRTGIDPDGRLRCSYNVTGTETGRWSSSKNVEGRGGNLQNWSDPMRRMVIPDPGKKFLQFDLAQAESVIVAALSADPGYIEAVTSGDPHTYVCELCWPDLSWPKGINDPRTEKKAKREVAERPYYRHYTYRDIAKRGGHGSNYGGTPHVLSMHLKVELKVAEDFQRRYFSKFPGIRSWQQQTIQDVAVKRFLETPLGRKRWFPGRHTDSSLQKEAIAYVPQSTIGDILNLGLYRVWEELDLPGVCELLLQVHDSILVQFDPRRINEADLIARITDLLRIPLLIKQKEWIIRSDAQSGWNWGKVKHKKDGKVENPYGLADWKGSDERQEPPPPPSSLDRRVCEVHGIYK